MPVWGNREITWRQVLPPAAVVLAVVAVGLAVRYYRSAAGPGAVRRTEEFNYYMGRLSSDNPATRAAATRLLGDMGDPRAVPEIRKLLADEDPRVVGAACAALGKLGDKDSANTLLERLDSSEPAIVAGAAEGLGQMGIREAAARVIPLLENGAKDIRLAAIVALGKLGDPSAIDALEKLQAAPWRGLADDLSDDERQQLQEAVKRALEALGKAR